MRDLEVIKRTSAKGWRSKVIDITYDVHAESRDLEAVLLRICGEAEEAASDGNQFIVLSDRTVSKSRGHVSSALAVGAVHHHLINTR